MDTKLFLVQKKDFILTEIDKIIITFLSVHDIIRLIIVDKYFKNVGSSTPKFIKWRYVCKEIHRLRISTTPFTTTHFIQACRFGYLDICLDLFEQYPSKIIKYDCIPAFRTSCRNNHFEIVKWLFEILLTSRSILDKNEFAELIDSNSGDCDVAIKIWLKNELFLLYL